MAIGDTTEMLAASGQDDLVQVFCTWMEVGTWEYKGAERPKYQLTAVRVVNDTVAPATVTINGADGTTWSYQVAPPGASFTLTDDQRAAVADGVGVGLAEG